MNANALPYVDEVDPLDDETVHLIAGASGERVAAKSNKIGRT